ncbi:hypothetical protein VTN02DRAFT_4362 [Thermoascus thermophilus]
MLQIALQSHRAALTLRQDNADALFNTAQVLTSLAELFTEAKQPSEQRVQDALRFLREALELFQRCLVLQELRYSETQEQIRMMEAADFGDGGGAEEPPCQTAPATAAADDEPQQEQWAAVIEPVTKNTLVDTAVAQLDTLTTLCNLLTFDPGNNGLAWLEEYSSELLRTKMPAYVEGSDRRYEASLARARFVSALSEVLYRSGRIDIDTYQRELGGAFGPDLDLSRDPAGLCSKAEALINFNAAVAETPRMYDDRAFGRSLSLRWQALSSGLDALTAASKLPTAENLPKIHLARGDAELARWRLGSDPWDYAMARDNAALLLRNAQTYYRGAAALARRDGAREEERDGSCKEAIAAALAGERGKLEQLRSGAEKDLLAVAEDMMEDGLVAPADMQAVLAGGSS